MALSELWKIGQHGNLEGLKQYLDKLTSEQCDVLLKSSHRRSGDNITHLLSRHGRLAMLQYICNCWCVSLEMQNHDGKVPLHEAAAAGHAEVVSFLLRHDVAVDPLKRAGWTPLMMACTKRDNLDCVTLLVDANANLHLLNKDGWNCFHIACRNASMGVVTYLHTRSASLCDNTSTNGRRSIHTAALHGREDVVRFLIYSCKTSINARDACGSTPFMDAVRSGHLPTVKLLLEQDNTVTIARNAMGLTCLHIAAEANQPAVLAFLLNLEAADVDCVVNADNMCKGQTPLHFAYKEENKSSIEMLLQHGANTRIKDRNGRTASEMLVKRTWP